MHWPGRLRPRALAVGGPEVSRAQIEEDLADPEQITMDFQPILDLRGTRTAGWEILARIGGRQGPRPDVWFATAYTVGLGRRGGHPAAGDVGPSAAVARHLYVHQCHPGRARRPQDRGDLRSERSPQRPGRRVDHADHPRTLRPVAVLLPPAA